MKSVKALMVLQLCCLQLYADEVSTEMHWNVCNMSAQTVIAKLGLDVKENETRELSYFDYQKDGNFALYSQNAILRMRMNQDESYETTAKVRVDIADDDSLVYEGDHKCERDLVGISEKMFCSLTAKLQSFNTEQKKFLADHQIDADWTAIRQYGPADNESWRLKRPEAKDFYLEQITLSPDEEILELSVKNDTENTNEEFAQQSAWLKQKEISLCSVQESKTKRVLEYFQNPH
jgi:hypothetical protein